MTNSRHESHDVVLLCWGDSRTDAACYYDPNKLFPKESPLLKFSHDGPKMCNLYIHSASLLSLANSYRFKSRVRQYPCQYPRKPMFAHSGLSAER